MKILVYIFVVWKSWKQNDFKCLADDLRGQEYTVEMKGLGFDREASRIPIWRQVLKEIWKLDSVILTELRGGAASLLQHQRQQQSSLHLVWL